MKIQEKYKWYIYTKRFKKKYNGKFDDITVRLAVNSRDQNVQNEGLESLETFQCLVWHRIGPFDDYPSYCLQQKFNAPHKCLLSKMKFKMGKIRKYINYMPDINAAPNTFIVICLILN